MDFIISVLGVELVDWFYKIECCGVFMTLTCLDIVVKFINDIFWEVKEVGVDVIFVVCFFC